MTTQPDPPGPSPSDSPKSLGDRPRRPVLGLVLYIVIAFALAWIVCLPLWLHDGLRNPLFGLCALVMMFTPTIAALIVTLAIERRPWRRPRTADGRPDPAAAQAVLPSLGLGAAVGAGRFVRGLLLALIGTTLLVLAALTLSAIVGTYPFDAALPFLADKVGDSTQGLLWLLAAVQVVASMLTGLINLPATLGEEIGWRGFLLPRLDALLPRPAAIVIMGVIWGLWHAPLILLGYNYPEQGPLVGLACMVVFCVVVGALMAWLRFRYGSVWPTAVAHATINTMVNVTAALFLARDGQIHTLTATLMGWPGWLLAAILAAVLFGVPALRPRHASSHLDRVPLGNS